LFELITVSEQCVGNVLIIFFFIFNVYILLMVTQLHGLDNTGEFYVSLLR